jgi:hypothetical protein
VIVHRQADRVLMDREALAQWTERSIHTIRFRCAVAEYDEMGRALYDAEACADLLRSIPTRHRVAA